MKKWLKKMLFISTLAIINLFTSDFKVDANTINSITMNVFLEDDGTGHVTEVWDVYASQGTEVYKPYGNLENYDITNFTVKDETGRTYTTLSNWNTGANFSSKAFKCGIVNTYNGVELCWGISQRGDKTYTLEYDIEGLVQQLKDAQSIDFGFMPDSMSASPQKVKITIDSKIDFNEENSKIWAFGYDGDINFEDGNIVMTTDGALGYSEYMVALVKFEENLFSTNSEINKNFEDVKSDAMEGSDYENNSTSNEINTEISVFKLIPAITVFGVTLLLSFFSGPIFIIMVIAIIIYALKTPSEGRLNFGKNGRILPNKNKVDYYRDIPCERNIYKGYFLVDNYFLFMSKDETKSGLMGAMFLKWIKEKRVSIVETRGGLFDLTKNEFALNLAALSPKADALEERLIYMLKEAAGANDILEAKEFERWCYSNYNKVNNWFEYATSDAIKDYVREGAIVEKTFESKTLFGKRTVTQKFVNPEVKMQATQMLGLRRFLLDYSLIAQREPIEVMLWEDYLIFAQLLGIADKVESQFKKLYPDFDVTSNMNISDVNICVRSLTYKGVRAAARAYSAAHSSSSSGGSRSSGGGGRSSSGGGRSSGGRSSGGGFR